MYTFKINPNTKPRQTRRDKWKQRHCVIQYRAFADDLRYQAKKLSFIVPAELNVVFYAKMPDSWSEKKKAEMSGRPHQQKPDIDNLVKAFLDALCEDDSYVYKVTAEKYWAEQGKIVVI